MNLSKLSLSQLINLSLAVFLLFGIAVTTYTVNQVNNLNAEAARGGGGKPSKVVYSASCVVNPNSFPVSVSSGTGILTGTGFPASNGVGYYIVGPSATWVGALFTDSNGNVTINGVPAPVAGTYTVNITSNTRPIIGAQCTYQAT